MCTYNRADLVPAAIRSVLAQTYRDFELVVVDDGSTDETRAAITAISDPRLRYVHRENGGLSAARNTGVAAAHGRVIAFLDDDDAALPTWLEQLHAAAEGDSDIVVTCGEMVVDDTGHLLRSLLPHDLGPVFESYRGLFLPGTFAVPRQAYVDAGGFAEGLQCSHQTEFALRLLPRCRAEGRSVIAVDQPLVRHVQRAPENRPEQTPDKTLQGVEFVLEHHEAKLARSPGMLSDWCATAGVAAARLGDYRTARRWLRRAVAANPRSWRHRVRLGLAAVPWLGDVVWRARRYRSPRRALLTN